LHAYVFDRHTTPPCIISARIAKKNLIFSSHDASSRGRQPSTAFTHAHTRFTAPSPPMYSHSSLLHNSHTSPVRLLPTSSFDVNKRYADTGAYGLPLHNNPYVSIGGDVHHMLSGSGITGSSSHGSHLATMMSSTVPTPVVMPATATRHVDPHKQPRPANPPGNTLFLAQITMSDGDLQGLLFSLPGYSQHKITSDARGSRVSFVEFVSEPAATAALQRLNGWNSLHASYSKNAFGQRTPHKSTGTAPPHS